MIYNVQALRALAALIVVSIHLKPLLDRLSIPVPGGGVDLFFVISGFIMVAVARDMRPGDFLARRAARIVPLYWALTLFTFAVAAVAPTLFKNTTANVGDLTMSLLFIPFVKGSAAIPQPVLFVGWTLDYEMFFYLIFAVGLALGRRGLIIVFATLILLATIGIALKPINALGAFYTSKLLIEFALGMAVERWKLRQAWAWTVTLATLPLVLYGGTMAPGIDRIVTVGIPAALLLSGAIALERAGKRLPRLSPLGEASYAIYLVHPFITTRAIALAQQLPDTPAITLAVIAAAFAVTCAMGWLIYTGFERPITKALNSLHGSANLGKNKAVSSVASLSGGQRHARLDPCPDRPLRPRARKLAVDRDPLVDR